MDSSNVDAVQTSEQWPRREADQGADRGGEGGPSPGRASSSLLADGVSDIFEIAISVTELPFAGEVTDLLVTVDGIVQQAGEAYSLLENASSAVSELSEAKNKLIQFADTALPAAGAVVEFTKQPAVFVNDVLLEPVTDFTYDKAANQITNLVDGVPTDFEATDVVDIFNIPPFG